MYFCLQKTSEFEAGASAFQKPHPINETSQSDDSAIPTDQSVASSLSQSSSSVSDTGQSDAGIVSRMHLSDDQRKYKERFEHRKYEEARKQAILDKKLQKEVCIE